MSNPATVLPLTTADHPKRHSKWYQWHKGRRYYGVWYLPIDDGEVVRYCQSLRMDICDILADGYERQWHITVFVNGFYVDECCYSDDFDNEILSSQIKALEKMALPRFALNTARLGSFINCAYLGIAPHPSLDAVRHALASVHQEIAPAAYTPHITLGLYRRAYAYDDVIKRLAAVQTQSLNLPVNRLIFATFDAIDLQGKLHNRHEIILK
ncbi:2'-5' RNA ligase family protein [Moraxella sp. FZLJ2107]|uniref:2'-5' RNA ligase family protein n=1 Tax=unclassified Moraxella TaxID=2685852 RepID=UPI0020C8888D|nr:MULTISPECIES: 2'-5' RNA ligase family protein [unclassified Moraxella]UTO04869.1 2'-5' RNA ligase family protein [Moraxella sp. FZLJ2107]UTO21603.1 2'-5' RNA ligase family protein [Moraxella sp. FZLJ2109]